MLKIGLIGCGHISETYFRSRDYFNNINITTCADLNQEAANKCANEYNIVPKSVDAFKGETRGLLRVFCDIALNQVALI